MLFFLFRSASFFFDRQALFSSLFFCARVLLLRRRGFCGQRKACSQRSRWVQILDPPENSESAAGGAAVACARSISHPHFASADFRLTFVCDDLCRSVRLLTAGSARGRLL